MRQDPQKGCRMDPAAEESLAIRFRRIDQHLAGIVNDWLRKDDITFSQIVLLYYLRERPGGQATQKEIGQALRIAHPTCIGLIRRLSCKKLVETAVDTRNRRFRVVRLTDRARDLIREADEGKSELEKQVTKGFSEEEERLLRDLLKRVDENLASVRMTGEEAEGRAPRQGGNT